MQRTRGQIGRAAALVQAVALSALAAGCGSSVGATGLPAVGQWQTGALDANDLRDAAGRPYDVYRIRIDQPGRYRFDLRGIGDTPLTDPVLRLRKVDTAPSSRAEPWERWLDPIVTVGPDDSPIKLIGEADLDRAEYDVSVGTQTDYSEPNIPGYSSIYAFLYRLIG